VVSLKALNYIQLVTSHMSISSLRGVADHILNNRGLFAVSWMHGLDPYIA